jgi:hypothetical protein
MTLSSLNEATIETAYPLRSSPGRTDVELRADARPRRIQQGDAANETLSSYYRSIAAGVKTLAENTEDKRLAMYEVARRAMLAELRAFSPPLSSRKIAQEQFALEAAIRQVETESTGYIHEHDRFESITRSRLWSGRLVMLAASLFFVSAAVMFKSELAPSLTASFEMLTDGGAQVRALLSTLTHRGATGSVELPLAAADAVERVILYDEDDASAPDRRTVRDRADHQRQDTR